MDGSEPYTDVIIFPRNSKQLNISFKGRSALSLAGGGTRGIETLVPGLVGRFMRAAYQKLISMGLKDGDKVPDVFAKLTDTQKTKLVVGSTGMGGPIDFMYIGSMEVRGNYDDERNVMSFNGSLIPAKEYAKQTELYLRLRARREDQRFDTSAQIGGIPKIYGRSPSRGDVSGRIVVTDQPASSGVYVEI